MSFYFVVQAQLTSSILIMILFLTYNVIRAGKKYW